MLRGVIFGIDGVLAEEGPRNPEIGAEITRLFSFLRLRGLQPVVLANRQWTVNRNGENINFQDAYREAWGEFPWFISNIDGTPPKQSAAATRHVLDRMGWQENEVIYVGNTEADFRSAINGNLLFLNALWYSEQVSDYGIHVATPKDLGRFIDVFCLRDHFWHFTIEDDGLRYFALGPYSTRVEAFTDYSNDALATAKYNAGHPDFWTKYLYSSIYFTGLHQEINYVAAYPGHRQGSNNPMLREPLTRFSHCFRINYLSDLIVRHTTATKSASARASGGSVDHLNQLNTININRLPRKGADGESYKSPPVRPGKNILVLDDICTQGNSFEAARAFLGRTGANLICISLLKTINRDYLRLDNLPNFSPYEPHIFSATDYRVRGYRYQDHIVDDQAPGEIALKLDNYLNWDWPE